ncbi:MULTISPECIES: hypothetical protein [unclassified Butyrivibrio]|uniref:hypothetical protein n=1 Tax=unclassified Butyrivibrio TaxID=2639466 RepID=UPI00040ABC9D|nr:MULTISPECIES: hypothetical protein [unclassified Butyrivibrio]
MMKRMREFLSKKIRSNGGFSLTELLLCTLIMMLTTSILVVTMRLAANHYDDIVTDSEATMLCRTLSLAIRDKLSYVVKVENTDDGIVYYSASQNQEYAPFSIVLLTADDTEIAASAGNFGRVVMKYTDPVSTRTVNYSLVNKASYTDYGDGLVSSCVVDIHEEDDKIQYFVVNIGIYKANKTDTPIMENEFVVFPILRDVPQL